MLASIIASSRRRTDPDAAAYIALLEGDGETVSATQRTAINAFYVTGKAEGWYSALKRIYLPIWGAAAPNARCMVSGTSGTFVNGVTHTDGYVNSDGSTGHFLFDVAPAALGLTTSSGSVFVLTTATSAISGSNAMGRVQDSNNNTRSGFTGGGTNIRSLSVSSAASSTYTETDSRGILFASRTSTTTQSAYKRTNAGFSTTVNEAASAVGAVGTVNPMTFMAHNNNGTVITYSSSAARFGSYGMGLGMTAAQAQNFTAALKTLWETCTGLTLP